jgi:hypothetical protein
MLTAVAVRRDVIDPDLFHCDPRGQLLRDGPGETDYQFWFADPCAVLPVLNNGRIILARWGCCRQESRVLPCTGWTTTQGSASRFWRDVGGRTVTVPAYLGYDNSVWVPLRSQVQAVLAYDSRGQPHAFIVCEPASNDSQVMTKAEWKPAIVDGKEPVSPLCGCLVNAPP